MFEVVSLGVLFFTAIILYFHYKEFKKQSDVLEDQKKVLKRQFELQNQQFKTQKENDLYNRTFDQIKMLSDKDFLDIRAHINKNRMNYFSDEEKYRIFSITLNKMGILYHRGYLEKTLIVDLYGGFLIKSWAYCEKFAMSKRREIEDYIMYFENMVKDIEPEFKKNIQIHMRV
jgi:hypothetical protein